MTHKIKQNTAIQVAVMLLTLGGMGHAWADTPLSLSVSETLTYDSNILRNNNSKQRDLVSTTEVIVGFDKNYGRQNYKASVGASMSRYKNLKQYDYDGSQVNLEFSTEIGARGFASINHSSASSLQDFGQQGLVRVREIIDNQNTTLNLRYGLGGWWSLTGSLSQDDQEYSSTRTQNRKAQGVRAGVRYNFTDLLYVDVGVRKSQAELPNLVVLNTTVPEDSVDFGLPIRGEDVDRTDLDIQAGWTITGYSGISGSLAWTNEKHWPDKYRSFKGLTWRANWNYTPTGKMVYSLALDRDTNNAGGNSALVRQEVFGIPFAFVDSRVQNRLSTTLSGSARWLATSKISASMSLQLRKLDESASSPVTDEIVEQKDTGYYKSLTLGLRYLPTRYLAFNCSLSLYDRSLSLYSVAYSGEQAACSATFSID